MLEALEAVISGRERLSILSVGAGTGLFEIPMLESVRASGIELTRFVGIDVDPPACRALDRRLRERFGDSLDFQVVNQPFEQFEAHRRFDLVLFVHTFEYLTGDPNRWIERARRLLDRGGRLVIFSPQRGGINQIYERFTQGCFSNDLERLLEAAGIDYSANLISAHCEIGPLFDPDHPDRIELLSFLTQLDCRPLEAEQQARFIRCYRSLQDPDTGKIPHPTTAFVIAA